MKPTGHASTGIAVVICLLGVVSLSADRPHWRGPNGQRRRAGP